MDPSGRAISTVKYKDHLDVFPYCIDIYAAHKWHAETFACVVKHVGVGVSVPIPGVR